MINAKQARTQTDQIIQYKKDFEDSLVRYNVAIELAMKRGEYSAKVPDMSKLPGVKKYFNELGYNTPQTKRPKDWNDGQGYWEEYTTIEWGNAQ